MENLSVTTCLACTQAFLFVYLVWFWRGEEKEHWALFSGGFQKAKSCRRYSYWIDQWGDVNNYRSGCNAGARGERFRIYKVWWSMFAMTTTQIGWDKLLKCTVHYICHVVYISLVDYMQYFHPKCVRKYWWNASFDTIKIVSKNMFSEK